MPGSFVDTNVLIYLASGDTVKADRAEAIIRDGGVISVQVLHELTNVAPQDADDVGRCTCVFVPADCPGGSLSRPMKPGLPTCPNIKDIM